MKSKRFIAAVLGLFLTFGIAGCNNPGNESSSSTPEEEYEYKSQHYSVDKVLRFFSSDASLDNFLNEFFERHMRYNSNRIHDFPIGAGQPVWKDWESRIGSFWEASPENLTAHYATNDWVRRWLTLDYMSRQDRQGYISTSTGITSDDWGQGWSFPAPRHNRDGSYVAEFTSGVNDWVAESGEVSHLSKDGEGYMVLSGNGVSSFTAVSPKIAFGSKSGMNAFYVPFLHFSWKYDLTGGTENNIDDLYVYFTTEQEPQFSEDKCVKYSEYASVVSDFASANGKNQGTFLNMFLNEKWGRNPVKQNRITNLKFALKAKPGTDLSGSVAFNFIRGDFDDRLSSNCGQYIIAAKNYLSYKQDTELLKQVLPVARGAMQFYLTCLDGAEKGVIDNSYLVGHFHTGKAANGVGIGDGFWDAISFPNVNFYSNLSYHLALDNMIYLEKMAEEAGIAVPEVTVLGKDMKTEVTYKETSATLTEKLERCRTEMRRLFWDDETGRFIAGRFDSEDGTSSTGDKMDYGFLMFNLQAITDGIATEEQAAKIMQWISGERTVSGDTSTGGDIYKYLFAPRFTTRHNSKDSTWVVGQSKSWENGVRNGGAVMQTSYYDILARGKVLGTEDAFSRLKGIEDFYYRVTNAGGKGQSFYRTYFDGLGIGMQGNFDYDGDGIGDGDHEGPIGIDCEFLEAALMFVSIPDTFFGIEPGYDGVLNITPSAPSSLKYWRLENLSFGGSYYDLAIGKNFVQISNVKAETAYKVNLKLKKPSGKFNVYLNGKLAEYTEEGGYVCVKAPFGNVKVEIKGA